MISFLNFNKKIFILILIFFISSLIFVEYQNSLFLSNSYILSVNGKKISNLRFKQEIEKDFFLIKNNRKLKNSFQDLSEKEKNNIQYQTISRLINEILFSQYAKNLGMNVNNEEIKNFIFSTELFLSNGKFDKNKFHTLIHNMGFTFDQYIDFIKEKILIYKFFQWIKKINFLTPTEIEQFISYITQIRVVRLAKVNLKNIVKNFHISSEEMYRYYILNKNNFFFPEKLKVSFISINPKNLEKNINVNKNEVLEFYKKNIKNFSTTEKRFFKIFTSRKINDILSYWNSLKNDSFKKFPNIENSSNINHFILIDEKKDYKKNTYTKEQQFLLKKINELNLNYPGQFSKIIQFSEKYYIILLDKINYKKIFPIESVYKKIVSSIKKKRSIDIYSCIRKKLLTSFDGTLLSAEKISGIKVKYTKWFDYEHLPTEINKYFFRKIFYNGDLLDTEGDYNNNYHIILDKDYQIFLIRIEKCKPKISKSFCQSKEDIKKEIEKNILFKKPNFIVEKIVAIVNKNKENKKIFKKLNIKFSSQKYFKYKSIKNPLEKVIFSIPFSKNLKKSVFKIFKDKNGDFFLISLDSIFQENINNQKKEFFVKKLKKYYENEICNCLVNQLQKNAKIKIQKNIFSNYFFQN